MYMKPFLYEVFVQKTAYFLIPNSTMPTLHSNTSTKYTLSVSQNFKINHCEGKDKWAAKNRLNIFPKSLAHFS